MNHNSVLAAVVTAIAASGVAHAGFRVEAPEYRPSVHPGDRQAHVGVPENYRLVGNKRLQYVEIAGTAPDDVVAGLGDDIPLDAALELIIPDRWLAYANPEIKGDQLVSWDSNQSWVDALRGIAVRRQLRIFIDANNQVVRVEEMDSDSALVRLASYDPSTGQLTSGAATASDSSAAPAEGGPKQVDVPSKPALATADAKEAGIRGDAFGRETQSAGFKSEVMTDEYGMPVTYVYPRSSNTAESSASGSSAITPPKKSPYPVSPGRKESEAIKARLAEQGLVAEAGESLPWFYRELPDGTRIRQLAGRRHPNASLTLTEYYAQLLVLNIRDMPVANVIHEIAPAGWDVDMALPDGYLEGKVISRLITERPRADVVAQLQQKLGITITPYPIQNLVVVTAK